MNKLTTVLGCLILSAWPAPAQTRVGDNPFAAVENELEELDPPEVTTLNGTLDQNDPVGPRGYQDTHTFRAEAGDTVTVDMTTTTFDGYLFLTSPSGQQWSNDDHGSTRRSLITQVVREAGEYTVHCTTFSERSTGTYELTITVGEIPITPPRLISEQGAEGPVVYESHLDPGDRRGERGYEELYTFEVVPGQSVTLDLTTDEFDCYIYLEAPSGEQWANDDFGRVGHSHLSQMLMEEGEYTIRCTSLSSGVTGSYELSVDISPVPENPPNIQTRSIDGTLDNRDQTLRDGAFYDVYELEGVEGDHVSIVMNSDNFDTYLAFIATDDRNPLHEENDDDGTTRQSRVEAVLPEDGRYLIYATSYRPGLSGEYRLTINHITTAGEPEDGEEAEQEQPGEADEQPSSPDPGAEALITEQQE